MKEFSNKTVIITGGLTGIGKENCLAFAKQGANIATCYYSEGTDTSGFENEIKSYGVDVFAGKCDVSNFDECQSFINDVKEKLGTPYVLLNNAGITRDTLMLKMSKEDFDAVINTNLGGTFNMIKVCVPLMLKAKEGRIISISSVMGLRGNAGQANYSASKAGIIGLTQSVSKEVGRRGITVNAIAPGFIETKMTDNLPEEIKASMVEKLSIKRLGQPEDIANTAIFLASGNASYITGQTIVVDGGLIS